MGVGEAYRVGKDHHTKIHKLTPNTDTNISVLHMNVHEYIVIMVQYINFILV